MNCSIQEWLAPANIAYLSECLQCCQGPEMVADLRSLAPAEALRQASKQLSEKKHRQIRAWVEELNNVGREVAV